MVAGAVAEPSSCSSCGAEHRPTDNFCANCGNRLREPPKEGPCRECGVVVPTGIRFCVECGASEPHRGVVRTAPARSGSSTATPASADAAATPPRTSPTRTAPPSSSRTPSSTRTPAAGKALGEPPRPPASLKRNGTGETPAAKPSPAAPAKPSAAAPSRPTTSTKPTAAAKPATGATPAVGSMPQAATAATASPRANTGKTPTVAAPPPAPRPSTVVPTGAPAATPAATAAASSTTAAPEAVPPVAPRRRSSVELLAAPEGWPDITDELAEVRFLVLQGFEDEANAMLAALRQRFGAHPDLERVEGAKRLGDPADDGGDDAVRKRREQQITVRTESVSGPAPQDPNVALEPTLPVLRETPRPVAPPSAAAPSGPSPSAASMTVVAPPPSPDAVSPSPASMTVVAPPPSPPPAAVAPPPSVAATSLRGGPRVPPRGLTLPSPAVATDTPVTSSAPASPPGAAGKRTVRLPDPSELEPVSPLSRPSISASDSAAETLEFDVDAEMPDDPASLSTSAGARLDDVREQDVDDVGETVVDLAFEPQDRTVISKAPPRPPVFDDAPSGDVDATLTMDHAPPEATFEGTVIARMPSPPAPWRGDDADEATHTDTGPTLPRTTIVPDTAGRPPTPAPFGGAPPPGSTLVPGTSPPAESLASVAEDPDEDEDDAATIAMQPLEAAQLVASASGSAWSGPSPAVTGATAPPGVLQAVPPAVTGQTLPPSPPAAEDASTQPGKSTGPRARGDARTSGVRLVMLGAQGEAVAERTLATGSTFELGREPGAPWGDDEFIEPRHVRVLAIDGGCSFEELVPTGAVFLRVRGRARLRDGDQLRVGQSLLAYDRGDDDTAGGPWGRLTIHYAPDGTTNAIPLGGGGIMLGRELGDVTLPDDTFVSSTHCRFGCDQNGVFVEDLDSSNGTYLRLRNGDRVDYGSCVLVGQTQFALQKR